MHLRSSGLTLTCIHRCSISAEENENLREDLMKEERMRAKAEQSRVKAEESLSDLQHRFVVSYLNPSI